MLTGEVALAVGERLARLLVAAELDVLADFPIRVGAEQERVRQGRVERRPSVPVRGDAGENRFDLLEEGSAISHRVRRRRLAGERRQRDAASCVVDEDTGRSA